MLKPPCHTPGNKTQTAKVWETNLSSAQFSPGVYPSPAHHALAMKAFCKLQSVPFLRDFVLFLPENTPILAHCTEGPCSTQMESSIRTTLKILLQRVYLLPSHHITSFLKYRSQLLVNLCIPSPLKYTILEDKHQAYAFAIRF